MYLGVAVIYQPTHPMHMRKILLLILWPLQMFAQQTAEQSTLLPILQEFAKTSAVTGREDEAADFVAKLFASGICKKDKLGDIIITIGSGLPRRLFAAPLDEPGYVISEIEDDGYLRITPVGYGHQGSLYHQFLEGNEIKINTEKGIKFGVLTVPSTHYDGLRAVAEKSKPPFQWQEAFVDVGEASAKAVSEKDIRLMDPLTINKKPAIMGNKYIAAPSAPAKSAVIALAAVAQTLLQQKFTCTVVIAFTTLELINGKGLEAVVNKYGPFDEAVIFNRFLQSTDTAKTGVLVDKLLPGNPANQQTAKAVVALRHPSTDKPAWGNATVYNIGLSSVYTATPVEMVSFQSIEALEQTWLNEVEKKSWNIAALKPITVEEPTPKFVSFTKEEKAVAPLIARYGVNPVEKPVRDYIITQLPKWAKPVTDDKGNIIVTFGTGSQHIAFVAHMDEVGFTVDTIRNDGTLVLKETGGFFNWVWEGHAALVHTANGDIQAVFEPRVNYLQASKRFSGLPITVYAGFASKQQAMAAGITEGATTVTMSKKMIRLSEAKACARGFDDRVGCAALLLALENINPNQLPFTVTFVFSTGEETGLEGATYASKALQDLSIVYPVDTYVSSDAPAESKIFGYCPLGSGAVVRVLESINFVSRANLHYMQSLASTNNIKLQYGMTAGGTDGQAFLSYGIPSVPLSWPGRYSHSPVEVMDFNDMHSLVQLVLAIMKDGNKKYE